MTVVFSDGSIAVTSFETPDESIPESFQLDGEGAAPPAATGATAVPEPSAAPLFGFGLLAACQIRSRSAS